MKRFLLSGMLLLAIGGVAYSYENDAVVQVPTGNPELVQLDTLDGIFVNNGVFDFDDINVVSAFSTVLYQTSDTLNYTNTGTMIGSPGFDFETFPASMGQAHMASSFVNRFNGFGGGIITVTGQNIVTSGGAGLPANFDIVGLSTFRASATNFINDGQIISDNTGLIDILGQHVDLRHGQLLMTNGIFSLSGSISSSFGVNLIDYGTGGYGTNTTNWTPSSSLTANFAISPIFTNNARVREQMVLSGGKVYFENTSPTPDATSNVVWQVVYIRDRSPANVTNNVFFDSAASGGGMYVQWAGTYRDAITGKTATNYFFLYNDPISRRNGFGFGGGGTAGAPPDFDYGESLAPLIFGTPASPGFSATPFSPGRVTNDFSFISLQPTAIAEDTNTVFGGSPTNIPGRIQVTSLDTLDLSDAVLSGASYVSLRAPNLTSYARASIGAAYSDVYLGVTNGSLILSNLFIPQLPAWHAVDRAPSAVSGSTLGQSPGIEAYSGSYIFVDANGITNDVRVLMVNSAINPTTAGLSKDVVIHSPNDLTIGDDMSIFGNFSSDTKSLTIATNDNSAYSLSGELIFLNPDIFWSTSLTNLQYLTNWGIISTLNLANFADNMPSLFSPRSGAIPYQAFVNNGTITNQGIFVSANYFENAGQLLELANGGIDVKATTANIHGGQFQAPLGPMSLTANTILMSNSIINIGRTLTLTANCFLSDGYVLGNQFGHLTNSSLPTVVTNGNSITVGNGVQILGKPPTGDLLGTTITNISANGQIVINVWPGTDMGCTPLGYAENLALGRMILRSDSNPSGHFTFLSPTSSGNALYVDSIQFAGGATNMDASGNLTGITIGPGMKIYYAQALLNGVSIAEKLNGKNGGGFCWVSNYAGVYSSTNVPYPGGVSYIFNKALVLSTNLDSDGDSTVNKSDATPIAAGLTFDIANAGPQACASSGGGGTGNGGLGGSSGSTGTSHTPGILNFPTTASGSAGVSFALAQGSYSGLFYETNGMKPASSGFFSAKLTGKGGLTAKLQVAGGTYSFTANLDTLGNLSRLVTGKNLNPLNVSLHLLNNNQIVGQISSGSNWTAQLLALASVPDASLFGTGKHSLVLSTDVANSTTDTGDSFGTMILNKNADIQWSGVLADGTKISQKSSLSKDGVWPLYSSLYGGTGSVLGWLQVTNGSSNIGGSAVWIMPANPNALYPNGLTNQLDASGADLSPTPAPSHVTVILTGPKLVSPLTNSITITGKSGKKVNGAPTLSLDVKNGLFSGTVLDPNSGQTLTFQGALLEKSGMGGGFFLNPGKDVGGKVSLAPAN